MSLTSWILDQFRKRQRKGIPRGQPSERRNEEIGLYLRRLEDRRVLTVTAVEDAYFVEGFGSSFFVSDQLGVLGNDTDSGGGTLLAEPDTVTTTEGGSVTIFSDGSFDYFSPFSPGSVYLDTFEYIATNTAGDMSSPVTVTLYGGEIPIEFDKPTLLPIFGVESETPDDFVQVNLFSGAGGSLFLNDSTGVTFDFGTNGGDDIGISGRAEDINRALETLEYTPPAGFAGFDDLFFDSAVFAEPPGGPPPRGGGPPPPPPEFFSQLVPLFVQPPGEGFPGPGQGEGEIVTIFDEYYLDTTQGMLSTTAESGVLSNDFHTSGSSLFAVSESITTDLGGTATIFMDGSFVYTPPDLPQDAFIDSFVYFASDEGSTVPGFVTLYVGEVPIPEDINILIPLFTVESTNPNDITTVTLSSSVGSSLLLFQTNGISFLSGFNGGSSFTITGTVQDVNFALDSLDYLAPLDFSGDDFVTFQYDVAGTGSITRVVPIDVFAIADLPELEIEPDSVGYLPGIFTEVDIDVNVVDIDGSEIPGFVVLDFVPPGVIPSVGQQSPTDPQRFFILPSDLDDLSFFINFDAPEFFTIEVIATSIETTTEPGVFGGPGGPLLPDDPFEPRFAAVGQALSFFRLPPPEVPPPPPENPPPPPPPGMLPPPGTLPPPPTEGVFLLGPFSAPSNLPPPPKLKDKAKGKDKNNQVPPPDAPDIVASVIGSSDPGSNNQATTSVLVSSGGVGTRTNDVVVAQDQSNEQSRRSYTSSGIYVRKLGSDGPGQTAQLPEELAEDYTRFMEFLKTLPNGDYVVYFKRSGQTHDQAALRQLVVKVRVVNHRLNPDPGEFKPAGEVAEPPQDPNAENIPVTTENPNENERAELSPDVLQTMPLNPTEEHADSLPSDDWVPIAAGAWMAAIAGWKLQRPTDETSTHIDRAMERYSHKPANRFRRRLVKSRT